MDGALLFDNKEFPWTTYTALTSSNNKQMTQPFTEPSESPCTKYLLHNRKMISTGTETNTEAPIIAPNPQRILR